MNDALATSTFAGSFLTRYVAASTVIESWLVSAFDTPQAR